MSPEPLSRRLRRTLLDHLWGQWSALGVAGYGAADGRIIDPEALLLCSLDQARVDARLFDAILDWCGVNGRFLAIPRLKALRGRHPVARSLAALADLNRAAGGGARWKPLREPEFGTRADQGLEPHQGPDIASSMNEGDRPVALCPLRPPRAPHGASGAGPDTPLESQAEPLFLTLEGLPLPQVGPPDPVFLRQGLRRDLYVPRGQASPFPPGEPAALVLSLRALLGSSARCEILAQLCGGQEQTPSQVARQTGYSQKNVQDAMVDMARSGHLRVRSAGRERRYRLDEPFRQFLCAGRSVIPYPWMTVYPLVARTLALLTKAEGLGLAEASVHPLLHQVLEASQSALLEGGLSPQRLAWETTEAFVALMTELLVGDRGTPPQ